jgi:hypothetical protein
MLILGCASNRGVLAVWRGLLLFVVSMMFGSASFLPASAQTSTMLHTFTGSPDGSAVSPNEQVEATASGVSLAHSEAPSRTSLSR